MPLSLFSPHQPSRHKRQKAPSGIHACLHGIHRQRSHQKKTSATLQVRLPHPQFFPPYCLHASHFPHTNNDRHLSRRPASRTPSPTPTPLPPLALAPTIYTLSGLFDEPLLSPSSGPSLPSPPPHSSPASSLLPSPSLRGKAKALFTGPPIYHSPASLGYALPPVQSNKHTEVAFLGRSNVGKSSLVAALLGGGNKGIERGGGSGGSGDGRGGGGGGKAHAQLVRTSKTPGCTQTLNLYSLQVGSWRPYFFPPFFLHSPSLYLLPCICLTLECSRLSQE